MLIIGTFRDHPQVKLGTNFLLMNNIVVNKVDTKFSRKEKKKKKKRKKEEEEDTF